MIFDDLLNDIEQLIELPLKAINSTTPGITLLSIDREAGRYIVKPEDSNRQLKRNIRELEAIFASLDKDGYCNVEQALQGSFTSRHQPETIFANLPYIQHFKFERRKHLVLIEEELHQFGELKELGKSEQYQAKKVLSENKNFSRNTLARDMQNTLGALKDEISQLHLKQPGFLVETNIRKIVSDLEEINSSIQNVAMSFKKNIPKVDLPKPDVIRDNNFDMSDLVDLSEFTGVTDDKVESSSEPDDTKNGLITELTVPSIRRQTPSLLALYQRLTYNEIEIQPEYQRQDRIWNDEKKSKLIESVLMGLPLPIFYFGERKNDNWVVIDGLQRLTTVYDFMQDKFALKLEDTSPVHDANGQKFSQFDRRFTRAINEFDITAYVIDMDGDSSSQHVNQFIIELFHRINTYGVKLSDQEIRSAIKFGNSVFYLKFLANTQTFISATNNTVNPKRQKDLELCLGALSFIIFGYNNLKINKYDDFLLETMDWINSKDFKKTTNSDGEIDYESISGEIINLTARIEDSLIFCKKTFGKNAFKKTIKTKRNEPISKTLFEVLVTIFANTNETQREQIQSNKENFIETLYEAINSDSEEYSTWSSSSYKGKGRGLNYSLSTSTGKVVTMRYRFESILNIIKKTTGCQIVIMPVDDKYESRNDK